MMIINSNPRYLDKNYTQMKQLQRLVKKVEGLEHSVKKITTFKDYQKATAETAIYPTDDHKGIFYCTMKLASEAGEVGGKVGKVLRDSNCEFTEEQIDAIGEELGDVLWYISQLCTEFYLDMSEVATRNIEKLRSRKERGVIGGSGDTR